MLERHVGEHRLGEAAGVVDQNRRLGYPDHSLDRGVIGDVHLEELDAVVLGAIPVAYHLGTFA
ncbi:MAG TPA: hypothetical protein VNB86_10545 [Gaiellaceae bacterium]|nr:hypothetical protein [Gaiellaceae bacterium]